MLSHKTIFIFATKCLMIYFILVFVATPLFKLEYGCNAVICTTGNTFYPKTKWTNTIEGDKSTVQFAVTAYTNGKRLTSTGTLHETRIRILLPFLFLLSLLIPLPFTWKRWFKTLSFGILGMWIYLVIFLKGMVHYGYATGIAKIPPDDLLFQKLFNTNIGYLTIIPIFIWALVSFRRSDLKQLNIRKLKSPI